MLGWALKKGVQGATGVYDAPPQNATEDTTQLDIPDTPAPVFAARAIKHAIFGAPSSQDVARPESTRLEPPRSSTDAPPPELKSPNKPTSILLTPGTGTAKRKRVSFDQAVKSTTPPGTDDVRLNADGTRKKTTLQRALENSRSSKGKNAVQSSHTREPSKSQNEAPNSEPNDFDADEDGSGNTCNHDMTIDLNEPQSNSGKYWKGELERYHDEAKAEMEKLVKYKELAKSYAKMKDAEAVDLNQKLKEEKEAVLRIEKQITAMAGQMSEKGDSEVDKDSATLMKELAKQTTLAVQYRDQVQELEALLKNPKDNASPIRKSQNRINTSPRTESTLLEVHRELRRARSELKQMDRIRKENERLKSDLITAQDERKELVEDNKRLANDGSEQIRMQRMEKQLRELKDDSRQKDAEIRKLTRDYEKLKRDAKSRTSEAMQVLQEKNDKLQDKDRRISELEKQIATLKATRGSKRLTEPSSGSLKEQDEMARNLRLGIQSPSKAAQKQNTGRSSGHRRTASAGDITVDLTQQSLIAESTPRRPNPVTTETRFHDAGFETRRYTENRNGRSVHRRERPELDTDHIDLFEDSIDHEPISPIRSSRHSKSHARRPEPLTDKLNESAPRSPERPSRSSTNPLVTSGSREGRGHRGVAPDNMSPVKDQAIMRGALDHLTMRPKSHATTALGAMQLDESEPEGIDLMQDRFARLGATEPKRPASPNASRCTLPADRQAAARARLQQKRLERQRQKSGGGRVEDKENLLA